jgi:acyl-coenzyme A thioesterase PaaI-like protein
VTDIGDRPNVLPGRLGVGARVVHGELLLDIEPVPEVCRHGLLRASVASFLVDAVSGITLDSDPGAWMLTTDMSVRMRAVPAPTRLVATNRTLRIGGRSATCAVDLTDAGGGLVGSGAIGFAKVPRREGDPPKHALTADLVESMFDGRCDLDRPLRDEAGIEVVDAGAGAVEVAVTPELRNPAGTLQGAMVALVAEVAAEELLGARFGEPAVVVELDLRYVAQVGAGPVRTSARLLGDRPDSPVEVELVDVSRPRLTTHVYARALTAH